MLACTARFVAHTYHAKAQRLLGDDAAAIRTLTRARLRFAQSKELELELCFVYLGLNKCTPEHPRAPQSTLEHPSRAPECLK
jgi:hypothetical protein